VAWGDYDNDGDLDILLTGYDNLFTPPISKVYRNTGSGFSEVYPGSLTGVGDSSIVWGDVDNDGDLDILLTGYTAGLFGSPTSKVYRNTGSGFSEVYTGSLTGVGDSSIVWGDVDNDGDLDILLTGYSGSSPVAKVYQNTGSGFTEVYPGSLTSVRGGSVAWGDYDNDGDLDILLTGDTGSGYVSKVYRNDDCPKLTGIVFPPRNAVSASLTTVVSLVYDEPISPTTVTSVTFAVHGMQSGLVTATHGVANADGSTVILTPTRPFHQGELVYAIATTRTLYISGTGPLTATQWQFNAGEVTSRCLAGFSEVYAGSLTGVYNGSVAWGDYDNDGDLDILLTGYSSGGPVSKVYRNTNSGFGEVYAGSLTGVYGGSAAWGDYDNDGDLDILLTGSYIAKVYRNTGNGFSEVYPGSLTGVGYSGAAWGDYDNDGKLDILLTGYDGFTHTAKVYQNTGSGFSEVYPGSLTGVASSSVAWGDYDHDGDLDVLLTGDDGITVTSKVYQNTGSGFSEVYPGSLTGVLGSSVAWGDYDNDGDLDILLTGCAAYDLVDCTSRIAKIYQNTGSGFTEVYAGSLTGVTWGSSVTWGDYDNDGDLDILLTGQDSGDIPTAKIYQNTGSGFTEVYTGSLTGVGDSSAAWGDYDNDGNLDILLTGDTGSGYVSKVYRNKLPS
jgi:predicted nucleotidyltransferase